MAIAATAALAVAGRHCLSDVHRIREAHPLGVVSIAVVHLIILWITGTTLGIGLKAYRQSISQYEGFALSVLGSYSNLLIPRAGIGVIGAYLKRCRNVTITDFSCVVIFNAFVFVAVCAAAGVPITVAKSASLEGANGVWVAALLAFVAVCSFAALVAPWKVPATRSGIVFETARRLREAATNLGNWRWIRPLVAWHVIMLLLRTLRLQIAFWSLGIDADVAWVLVASLLGDVAFLLAITPTALGFREAAVAVVAEQLGVPASTAISVALLDRLVFSLTSVVAAQIIIVSSVKRMQSHTGPTDDSSELPSELATTNSGRDGYSRTT